MLTSNLFKDLKSIYHIAFRSIEGSTHKQRLESFYSGQSEFYDDFRKRLLPGRESLAKRIPLKAGQRWLDLGGGTGANLDYLKDSISELESFSIIDLSGCLLKQAQKKVDEYGLDNVKLIEADVTTFEPGQPVDGIIFSYSLTMIPDWFKAVDHALSLLKPGGHIAVVDFFVSRKYADSTANHNWWTRSFWPVWFATDGVYLSSEHVPYLKSKFQEDYYFDGTSKVPYVPLGRVPFYLFIGEKAGLPAPGESTDTH